MVALFCPPRNTLFSPKSHPHQHPHLQSLNPKFSKSPTLLVDCRLRRGLGISSCASGHRPPHPKPKPTLLGYTAASASAAILLLGFGLRLRSSATALLTHPQHPTSVSIESSKDEAREDEGARVLAETQEWKDEEFRKAFEAWKSKPYALSVPLKIIALQGSIPPSWAKEFMQSQGPRLKFQLKTRGTLEEIFNDVSMPFSKKGYTKSNNVGPASAVAADVVSIGDSWLSFAIKRGIIEPIRDAEEQDWFKGLSPKWKTYLRRNCNGDIDPEGEIWAAPYRWGSMVIAYKKSKFEKYKLDPLEDWADLWRPELAGRISMVNCPREIVGAVLKYMGASYNTVNIDVEVAGGRKAVHQNLASLAKQVRIFDSTHYLNAFRVGDVWVAVGCSSDVLPVVKRMSNVAVIVPKSGASLWADLWAIPAATRLKTSQIGGRIRGPSPLIHQWIEFCLQAVRVLPFNQGVIPGASPSCLEGTQVQLPKLETDLLGLPRPGILARCEFLEPLSESTISDYGWLTANMPKIGPGLFQLLKHHLSPLLQTLRLNSMAANR